MLIRVACKSDARSRWLQELIARRRYNRATVALANKNARIIQAMLSHETNYQVFARSAPTELAGRKCGP